MDTISLLNKKRKFDNGELKITDLTEQEVMELNEMYKKEIEELKKQLKSKLKLLKN